MITLVCFLEERSAQEMLKIILPKILPVEIQLQYFAFQGKQDLEKNIKLKLKYWNTPNTVFLVMRDQDSGDCSMIKQELLSKVRESGKEDVGLVRIACRELESFYLGDLSAVEQGLEVTGLTRLQDKVKFRNPDNLNNAKEELKKITKDKYQQIAGSKNIARHLKLDNSNNSTSFNVLLNGITRLIQRQQNLTICNEGQ